MLIHGDSFLTSGYVGSCHISSLAGDSMRLSNFNLLNDQGVNWGAQSVWKDTGILLLKSYFTPR